MDSVTTGGARVARAKRNPSSGESEREDWLRRGPYVRSRPWAFEEELFGPGSGIARHGALEAFEADLAAEQSELAHIAEELHRHASRIAGLKTRLAAPMGSPDRVRAEPGSAAAPGTGPSGTPAEPDYRLSRCEGFDVNSPTRRVGVVEGLRYLSRIDRPDVLEVRAGPFGRQLLLIPVEEVDQILVEEGRLILRSTPRMAHQYFYELLGRLRVRRNGGSARAI
jgi:hypothetical protein